MTKESCCSKTQWEFLNKIGDRCVYLVGASPLNHPSAFLILCWSHGHWPLRSYSLAMRAEAHRLHHSCLHTGCAPTPCTVGRRQAAQPHTEPVPWPMVPSHRWAQGSRTRDQGSSSSPAFSLQRMYLGQVGLIFSL